jgi:hypothetical protein
MATIIASRYPLRHGKLVDIDAVDQDDAVFSDGNDYLVRRAS